jgi:glycosyltransferase involved in cell wall biosynthesis
LDISIAISACNSARLLEACLAGLLRQTAIGRAEVFVIDSGSDEDERSVCAAFEGKFPRLVYERTPRETLYAAWNRALAMASGRYFVNVNTDDALHPRALAVLADALDSDDEAVLAYGDWMWATEPNALHPWDPEFRRCVHGPYHPTIPLFYTYSGCLQFWRTGKLRELGGFNAGYQAAGDYDILCRMALRRWHAVYVPMTVSAFYQNPEGLSRSSQKSYLEFLEIRDRFRSRIAIDDLYDVDPTDDAACARAWIDLGRRALSLFVPWAEESTPEPEFAAACARRALALDPWSHEAMSVLAAATAGWRAGVRRTIARATALFAGPSLPPPRARTPSPVFRAAEQTPL